MFCYILDVFPTYEEPDLISQVVVTENPGE